MWTQQHSKVPVNPILICRKVIAPVTRRPSPIELPSGNVIVAYTSHATIKQGVARPVGLEELPAYTAYRDVALHICHEVAVALYVGPWHWGYVWTC